MMDRYAIYDLESGAIQCIFETTEVALVAEQGAYVECGEGVDDTTHYVLDGVLTEKQELDTSHTVEGLTLLLHALPSGVRIHIEGLEVVSGGDGDLIEFEVPGEYTVSLFPPAQYREAHLEVAIG